MSDLTPGQHWLTRFRLLDAVASSPMNERRGGGHELWLAQRDDGVQVALKFIKTPAPPPALLTRFADWRALRDAGLVKLLGVHTDGAYVALEMPWLDSSWAQQFRGAPAAHWLAWAALLAARLDHLHSEDFIHGDVKLQNVVTDETGEPILADPWMPGDGLSVWSASPERRRGEGVSRDDDTYAFGALLHELLTGYPPGYPDPAAPPVKEFTPATAAPVPLTDLCRALLATSPGLRPPLAQAQRLLSELAGPQTLPLRPPVAAPIRVTPLATASAAPRAQRAARIEPLVDGPAPGSGPAEQLFINVGEALRKTAPPRRSYWRWALAVVVAAGIVTTAILMPKSVPVPTLPQRAETPAPHTASAPAPAPRDLRALGEAKLTAEDLRGRADRAEKHLRDLGATARRIAAFETAAAARARGDDEFAREQFDDSRNSYGTAMEGFAKVEAELPALYAAALKAGDAALGQCQKDAALQEYNYALALAPGDARASDGAARAKVCEQVFALTAAGRERERAGEAAAAADQYRAALSVDPKSSEAAAALQALNRSKNDADYSRSLASALEAMRARRYSAASMALAAAEKIRPGTADAARLRAELAGITGTVRVAALRAEAADDERREHWNQAAAAYRSVLDQDSTLRFARDGRERAEARAALAAELAGYIDQPQRLAAAEVREAAKAALERARAVSGPSVALAAQAAQVQSLLSENAVTVEVALNSDGLTDVTIFRIGRLGSFSERRVGLKPGIYTIVGSRDGYRDVRREITVKPGQSVLSVEIHCEDEI